MCWQLPCLLFILLSEEVQGQEPELQEQAKNALTIALLFPHKVASTIYTSRGTSLPTLHLRKLH